MIEMYLCTTCDRILWSFEKYGRHMENRHGDEGWEWNDDEGVLEHNSLAEARL